MSASNWAVQHLINNVQRNLLIRPIVVHRVLHSIFPRSFEEFNIDVNSQPPRETFQLLSPASIPSTRVRRTMNRETQVSWSICIGLQSVLVDEEIRLNRSQMSFTVTNHPRSDFDSLRLDCMPKENQTSVCSNVTLENGRCSTTFRFPGTAGCDYQCSIDTVKSLFSPISSKPFQITVGR